MKKLVLLVACLGIFVLNAACAVDASGKDTSDSSSGIPESQWSDKNVDENGWT